MTLLVDPAVLYATGYGLGRWVRNPRVGACAGVAVAGTVLGLSVATYRDAPAMRPVWEFLGGRSGRDLILNSWVLHFDPQHRSARRQIAVAALFASYPVWTTLGLATGRRRRVLSILAHESGEALDARQFVSTPVIRPSSSYRAF